MNDWRSSFGGANDHEADWEQVTVYLGAEHRPSWVAFSAHDEIGDDLRRRWDDPDLEREGDHPVVSAGAGSHSGAVVAGEYVTAVKAPAALGRAFAVARSIARVLTPWSRGEIASGLGIPFIDCSRGDGDVIGPDHAQTWSPVLVDDTTPWIQQCRGLWGVDTRDRFGGERAPAGPRYERGGAVRQSWSDPVGWCGLQKVPASEAEMTDLLCHRVDEFDVALCDLDDDITRRRTELRRVAATAASIDGRQGMATTSAIRQAEIASASAPSSISPRRERRSPTNGPPTWTRSYDPPLSGHRRPTSATSTSPSVAPRTSATGSCGCGRR